MAIAAAIWLLSAAPSMATTAFTVRETIPLDGVVIDGCDEQIMLSGSLSAIFHVTELDSGAVTGVSVSGPSGLSGTGLTSGAMYRAVGVTVNVGHQDAPPGEFVGQMTLTLVDRTRTVGTAGAATLDIRTTFHLTKVDGESVVIFEHGPYVTCG
jgi:hypothetical protein